jgi:hypothetical protein
MAAINVKEVGKDRRGSSGEKSISLERSFTVLLDSSSSVTKAPLDAYEANGVPKINDQHPDDSNLYVDNKTVDFVGGSLWLVRCFYKVASGSFQQGNQQLYLPPLSRPPKYSYHAVTSQVKIDRDIHGKAITNSASKSFDPPITIEVDDVIMRVERNEETFNVNKAAKYIGAVNSDEFYGIPPGFAKCIKYNGDPARAGSFFYYEMTYEILIRLSAVAGVNPGHKVRILDEGFGYKNADGEWEDFKDAEGAVRSEPTKLDGSGGELPDGADEVFLEFEVYEPLQFSELNL